MQFTITTLLSLLAVTVVAAPVGPDVTALTGPVDQVLEEVGKHTPGCRSQSTNSNRVTVFEEELNRGVKLPSRGFELCDQHRMAL